MKEQEGIAHLYDSLLPLETIVKERQIEDNTFIDKGSADIQVYFLPHDPGTKGRFLMIKVVNHTQYTISLSNDRFLSYDENANLWISLRYPDNYSRDETVRPIPPGETRKFQTFFPLPNNCPKGKYRLQLVFRTTAYQSYYYIDKDFLLK